MHIRCVLSAMLLAAAAGCLRRIEVIDVAQDGAVRLTTVFEGDVEDVRKGYAMPAQAGGWSVVEKEEKDGENTKLRVTASRTVPPGGSIPETYADPGSASFAREPRFVTSLRVERRDDGAYYHFTRRYLPRRWAQFDYHHDKLIDSGEVRALAEKDPKELTDSEREKLAEQMIKAEALKTIEFLNTAAASAGMTVPTEALIATERRVQTVYQDPKFQAEAIGLLGGSVSKDEAPEKIEQRLLTEARRAVEEGLSAGGLKAPNIQSFLKAYDEVRGEYAMTEDLNDEQWAVALRMPGKIIACNVFDDETLPSDTPGSDGDFASTVLAGDDFPRGPDRCGWSFDGDATYDREVLLMATSFVPTKLDK